MGFNVAVIIICFVMRFYFVAFGYLLIVVFVSRDACLIMWFTVVI